MSGGTADGDDDEADTDGALSLGEQEVALVLAEAGRLDKAAAAAVDALGADGPGWSRSRLRALIEAGAAALDGVVVRDPAVKARAGATLRVRAPAPAPIAPRPEAIPLTVAYEDAHLIVVDKPVGMAAHPAPGAPSGTLVNALLAHCGDSLSGVGGAIRPGIVHRIDKETSGLLVAAKTDAAHRGLAEQFAAHSVERSYLAVCWGAPDAGDPRLRGLAGVSFEGATLKIDAPIARHRSDRKRMAVAPPSHPAGKRAVTRVATLERYGAGERPAAGLIRCRLETGRTHQIRCHLTYAGHALVGDPVYGRARPVSPRALPAETAAALTAFPRQALHAETLGFVHPISGAPLRFGAPPPPDLETLITALRASAARP